MIIGAIIGAILAYIAIAAATDGPKFPGDASGDGIGCLISLVVVGFGGIIGAVVGTAVGLG